MIYQSLAKHPRLTVHLIDTLRKFQRLRLSSRIAMETGVTDSVVRVWLPGLPVRRPSFKMNFEQGRDLVAADLWFKGFAAFERPMPQLFYYSAAVRPGRVLDVGANTGLYSFIAAAAHADNKVDAFEPYPPVIDLLEKNINLNRQFENISVHKLALGAESGSTELYIPLQDHGVVESSCSLNKTFKDDHSNVIPVTVTTIDQHLAESSSQRISLVKIDVEGTEADVLRGASNLLEKHRPLLFMEILPSADIEKINEIRDQSKYVSYQLHPDTVVREGRAEFHPNAWNHLFVPVEDRGFIPELARSAGLALQENS